MSGDGTPVYEDQAMRDAVTASVAAAYHGVSAKRKRDEESLEKQKREFAQEVEKVRTDAAEAAAKVKEDAETEAAEIRRVASAERAALDAEKAAMEQTYEFQTKKVHLDVGGHKFTTSLPTLTSVPDTYLEVMFSGRYPLAADPDGEFFIDRNGDLFRHILSYLRDPGRDE
jgi:vacuolar-type H+-ATPase subunit I/STV1